MSAVSDAIDVVWNVVNQHGQEYSEDAMNTIMEYLNILESEYSLGDDDAGLYEEGGLLYEEDEDDGQPSEHDEWMDYDPDC